MPAMASSTPRVPSVEPSSTQISSYDIPAAASAARMRLTFSSTWSRSL